MTQRRALVIDTDPGVDDAVAILMALAAPGVDLVGLTAVGGNVPLARATRNALALLQAAGRSDVPVARGAAKPLRGRFRPSAAFHGPGGLSVRLPNPVSRPVADHAAEFMAGQLSARPGQITIVALGPLTNLARVLRRHPLALGLARRVVVMGGAVGARGNVTPQAEFNFHSDPDAAAAVMASGISVTVADLAACRQVAIGRGQALEATSDGPLGRLALRVVQNWFRRDPSRQRFEFYDPLAVAMAIDPQVATARRVGLEVAGSAGEYPGESRLTGSTGEVSLLDQVDRDRFFKMLGDLLGWKVPSRAG